MVRKLSNQHIGVNSTENIISIKMLLAAVISQEKSNLYVSYCPVLDLYSQGSTSQEAEKISLKRPDYSLNLALNATP